MDKWKTIAVIFITLFIVETFFFCFILYIGSAELNKKTECSKGCFINNYDSFYFDGDVCYCYKDNEIKYKFNIP